MLWLWSVHSREVGKQLFKMRPFFDDLLEVDIAIKADVPHLVFDVHLNIRSYFLEEDGGGRDVELQHVVLLAHVLDPLDRDFFLVRLVLIVHELKALLLVHLLGPLVFRVLLVHCELRLHTVKPV